MARAGLHHAQATTTRPRRRGLGLRPRLQVRDASTSRTSSTTSSSELIDKYGVNTVRNGGLKVYTTINPALQADAQQAVDACAVCYSGGGPPRRWSRSTPRTATSSRWPPRSRTRPTSQFNLAAHGHRQPGSSFKPFVLTTAISQGIDPDTTYYSGASPITLTLPDGITVDRQQRRAGGGVDEPPRRDRDSVNTVFAQLDLDVGPENVRQTAYKLGITTHLDGIPAEGIGGLRLGVTPLEQADAYATLRRRRRPPRRDRDRQGRLPRRRRRTSPMRARAHRVISDGIAYEVTDILKGVITEGTGSPATRTSAAPPPARPAPPRARPTPGSSATRRRISTAVWVGHPTSREPCTGFGGPTAGPIWHDYMEAAHGSYCDDFPQPQNPVQFSNWSGSHTRLGAQHAIVRRHLQARLALGREEQRQVPAQPVRAGRRPGARSDPREQRRRRRGASGQLRRWRRRGRRRRPGRTLSAAPLAKPGRGRAGAPSPARRRARLGRLRRTRGSFFPP